MLTVFTMTVTLSITEKPSPDRTVIQTTVPTIGRDAGVSYPFPAVERERPLSAKRCLWAGCVTLLTAVAVTAFGISVYLLVSTGKNGKSYDNYQARY